MKKLFLILLIIILSVIGYSQTVDVKTTLLRIDGVAIGKIVSPDVEILPIAWETHLINTDTLDWTTVPIDSLQFINTQLQNQVNQLLNRINELEIQFNLLSPRFELMEFNLDGKLEWGDLILIGKPETTIE